MSDDQPLVPVIDISGGTAVFKIPDGNMLLQDVEIIVPEGIDVSGFRIVYKKRKKEPINTIHYLTDSVETTM